MKPGDKFLYNEDGYRANVTLERYELQEEKWHAYELRVDEVISFGPYRPEISPMPGDVMKVGYRDGYQHYAGWGILPL